MRINPSSVSFTTSNRTKEKTPEKGTKGVASGTPIDRSHKMSESPLISRSEMETLASNLKNGSLDREEASNQFIGSVVNRCVSKLGEKDRKQLILEITEFFSHDQRFLSQLEKNLRDLT